MLTLFMQIQMSDDSSIVEMPDMLSASCPPVHFIVPLFGGMGGVNSTDSMSTYHTASDQAHTILGLLLLCMVISWSLYVMEMARLPTVSRMSGSFQLAMGVYLFSWLFFFMHPQDLRALWAYSVSDLLQLQHFAIAFLLCAGGVIELLQSFCLLPPMASMHRSMLVGGDGLPTNGDVMLPSSSISHPTIHPILVAAAHDDLGSHWLELWATTLVMVGLVFMLHPQHSYSATIKHLVLGGVLVLGSPLMVRGKRRAWKAELVAAADPFHRPPVNSIDWSMVVAGGCFALAACVLVAFREHENVGPHIGTTPKCQPAFVIVVAAYILAGGALIMSITSACKQFRIMQRKRNAAANAAGAVIIPSSSSSSSFCLLGVCADIFRALRASRAAKRLSSAFGTVMDEEKEGMVELEQVQVNSSTHSNAATHDTLHVDEEDAYDEDDIDIEIFSSTRPAHTSTDIRRASPINTSSSNTPLSAEPSPSPGRGRDLVHRYAMQANGTAHTNENNLNMHASDQRTENGDGSDEKSDDWRERQRDARRQESYTGEEDD
jgi:hypothetical protein